MPPLPPVPRPSWLPGALILAGSAAAAGAAGWSMGARDWQTYVGFALGLVLALGLVERLWVARKAPRPPRSRGRLKVLPGGKSGFDLEKDDPEHRQRWLM